jgi:P pilus assembly chaperone PapD
MSHGPALTLLLLLAPALLPAQTPAPNQGLPPSGNKPGSGVMVSPTRLVISSRQRTGEVVLLNPGDVPGTFRVALTRMEMDDNGACREVRLERVADQLNLHDLVRFSPKLVTLQPKESQVVRIQVRRPADLPTGEYRLHMVFREEPPLAPEAAPGAKAEEVKGLKVQITSVFGVAIPLIIRQGETSATAALVNLALDPERRHLSLRLERQGNQSLHGNFQVRFKPLKGPEQLVGEANGLSVFTPNAFRNVVLPLKGGDGGAGRYTVTFALPTAQGGARLAEASLDSQ